MAVSNTTVSKALRFLLALFIVGIGLTGFGIYNVSKDLGSSNGDFSMMQISDFRKDDVIHGTISETIGCAVRYESSSKSGKHYTYYYIIPYFESVQSDVPTKVMCYSTGNQREADALSTLAEETFKMYVGSADSTTTRVTVDRAEVNDMTAEEYSYIRDYIGKFVDVYYEGYDTTYYLNAYMNALVPFIVHKNAISGTPILTIGLVILFIVGVIFLIVIFVKKRAESMNDNYTYVGSGMNENYNATYTGSSEYHNYVSTTPSQSSTYLSSAKSPYDLSKMKPPTAPERTEPDPIPDIIPKKDTTYRPVTPPIYTAPPQRPTNGSRTASALDAVDMMLQRERMKNNVTSPRSSGAPPMSPEQLLQMYGSQKKSYSYSTVAMNKRYEGVDDRPLPPLAGEIPVQKQEADDRTVRPNLYEDEYSKYVPYSALHERKTESSDSMPSIDLGNREYADISNGGIPQDETVKPNVVQPHNNGVPIINPDNADEAFESKLDIPEMPQAPEIPSYTGGFPTQSQPHPIVSPEMQQQSSWAAPSNMPEAPKFPTYTVPEMPVPPDFQVQPTDESARNSYVSGGHMEEVDPYTEKNVDLSNGGRELPEE